MTEVINPIDTIFPIVAQAVEEWRASIKPEDIKKKVTSTLNAQGESVILKLLGFNSAWGGWEVDHCNGRAGESAAGDYFKSLHQVAIKEWFESNFTPKLSETDRKKIQKSVQADYVSAVVQGLRNAVEVQADNDVQKLIADICKSTQADNYLKIRELLAQTK